MRKIYSLAALCFMALSIFAQPVKSGGVCANCHTKKTIEYYPLESSFKDVSLNETNLPQGSVTVTAGGVPLVENVDFVVDHVKGRLQMINQAIVMSGVPIKIVVDSAPLYSKTPSP